MNRKIIAGFELTLMMVGMFAFSYGVAMTDDVFVELNDKYEKARAERLVAIGEAVPYKSKVGVIFDIIFGKLKEPMIPVVSAEGLEVGCCALADNGKSCLTTTPESCVETFALGALCAQTSFCKKGCCYDVDSGIYEVGTREVDCPTEWVDDPNCNMPGARKGCCVLDYGTNPYETYKQCEVRVNSFAQGDGVVDWRGNLDPGQCMILSAIQKEGACVLDNGECEFGTEASCYGYDGEFNEGYLCTSPLLNTSCEMTEHTTCVDGKDGVYFLDSCGNVANIYDSARVDDPVYWDLVAASEDICGDDDVEGGNADSPSCGNCNRFLGGICGSADGDNFDVDVGEFYCKDTSCMVDGEVYGNGESWCVYDGVIGNGDDVVGSRHWKYVCSQGTTQVEPCADYRNQICIQSNTFEVNSIGNGSNGAGGTDVEFRNANCVANNWRECVDLNSHEDGLEMCEDTLNCRVEKVDIADKFKFDVCLPRYPGGFSLKDTRYMETAEQICGMADQTCTVVYKETMLGGCEIVANEDCLHEGFARGMNDFCRGLGDCGGAVNIEGVYSENYKIEESPYLSQKSIDELKELATPVPGQFAEVEDYTKFLEAAGLWGNPGEVPEEEEPTDYSSTAMMLGAGVAGIGVAVVVSQVGIAGAMSFFGGTLPAVGSGFATTGGLGLSAGAAGFAGAAIGAGIGMIAGMMLGKALGLSPGGSMLIAVGGGMVGGAIGYGIILGWGGLVYPILIAGIILMLISLLFGAGKCDPVEVTFECKPWKAPVGGGSCENCNNDSLKPCSEYRCNSLGAACELINVGTEEEMCHSSKDDGRAPILRLQTDVISESEIYSNITDNGFGITNSLGGCVDAYTPLVFGVNTDALAYCKYDIEPKDFADMDYDMGGNAYLYNHTTTFTLPDPSHGQSQGSNWTGDLNMYIKCQDAFGHETSEFYIAEMCVKEGKDVTGPLIRGVDPADDSMIGVDVSLENFTIVTNEVSTCKWDFSDVGYSEMANSMICNDSLIKQSSPLGYVCTDVLPTDNSSNIYYIRCMDQPWLNESSERNANVESFVYSLRKPLGKISIEKIAPNADFEIDTAKTTIELKVLTANGGDLHYCSYSFSGYDKMIKMFETGEDEVHVQSLERPSGWNKIYVECNDETGDYARDVTEFRIVRDTSAPQIARVWQNYGTLHVVTTEAAECQYSTSSCRFNWGDGELAGSGEEHRISVVKGDTYYIKCEDEFGNAPADCSITVRAL